GRRDSPSTRAEGGVVDGSDGAGAADEKQLALAVGDVPDVGGSVLARGHERPAAGGELLSEHIALVGQDMEELAGAGVPDPRRVVVTAAREQLASRAERERPDAHLGEMLDHAAGARAEDRCGRRLPRAGGNREDPARRIEDSREHAAAEGDRL